MTGTITTEVAGELEALWREHHREVQNFVRKRTSSDTAEDVVAETFVAAAQALSRGADVQPGWLMTVAKRRLIDHWRRTDRNASLLMKLDAMGAGDSSEFDFDDSVIRLLMKLPERQRQALLLRYWFGYSIQSIADELGITYSASESLLSRAKAGVGRRIRYTELDAGRSGQSKRR